MAIDMRNHDEWAEITEKAYDAVRNFRLSRGRKDIGVDWEHLGYPTQRQWMDSAYKIFTDGATPRTIHEEWMELALATGTPPEHVKDYDHFSELQRQGDEVFVVSVKYHANRIL